MAAEVAAGKTADFGKSSPLIVRMVQENPTWGEERIAAELSVKLGILVSGPNGAGVLAAREGSAKR